jgi:hypothetical protein
LALVSLWAGSARTALATPPATQPSTPAPPAQATAPGGEIMVVEGGRSVGQTTPEKARHDGLTVVDLSDDWLQEVFSEAPGKPQPLRPFLIDLANGRFRPSGAYAHAREDRFFEAFGIFPSLNLVRRRLADKKRHACHERVKDAVLQELPSKNIIPAEEAEKIPNPDTAAVAAGDAPAMIPSGRTISPRPLTAQEKRAVVAMQAHLRCEDLLQGKASPGRMDRRTVAGLQVYQRLQMLADSGNIDLETRTTLLGDSREQDFRALLRALRERVVDATGLLEDGSALGVLGEVQGRALDGAEFRPTSVQPSAQPAPSSAPPPPAAPAPQAQTPARTDAAGAEPPAAKLPVTAAPDLIAAATQAASQALGWTSPEAVLASTLVAAPPPPPSRRPARKAVSTSARRGPAPLPPAVAIRLPPPPPYHSPKMDLRAEIDRGEVNLTRPVFDKEGKKKWRPPVTDRPTITLYARVGDHEVALMRWPTTIGGWKTIQRSDGTMALKYKESVTGDALWPEILATPTWHPPSGIATSHLLVKRGDVWQAKSEVIGPGYHAAYGLVAIVHHQIEGYDEHGAPQLADYRIRTHGIPIYRSVKRGESSGCHRLHNHMALRLASFLLKHRTTVRDGLVPEDYVRHLEYKGQQVSLASDTKGYRFQLTPPIPVTTLEGDVRGNRKGTKQVVPVAVAP